MPRPGHKFRCLCPAAKDICHTILVWSVTQQYLIDKLDITNPSSAPCLHYVVVDYAQGQHHFSPSPTFPITTIPFFFTTYLLTPWCRVLHEKLTGLQLVKKFPAFHGTRRFITALTSVRHLSLSCSSPIQSIYPHPTSWRSILISTHLRLGLPSGFLPSGFPTKTLYTPLSSPICATCPVHLILFDFITRIFFTTPTVKLKKISKYFTFCFFQF